MKNHAILKNYWIKTLTGWRDYFSSRGKPAREKYCVHRFLQISEVPHDCEDLISLEEDSVIDVQWNDLKFQVKEITDPDINRGEIKTMVRRVRDSDNTEELNRALVGQPRDVPLVTSMYDLVSEEAKILAEKGRYVSMKPKIDLLFYVTRSYCSLLQVDDVQRDELGSLGWRSISVVNEKQAVVLSASSNAPDLLLKRKGRLYVA